jgi:hypothetical protein
MPPADLLQRNHPKADRSTRYYPRLPRAEIGTLQVHSPFPTSRCPLPKRGGCTQKASSRDRTSLTRPWGSPGSPPAGKNGLLKTASRICMSSPTARNVACSTLVILAMILTGATVPQVAAQSPFSGCVDRTATSATLVLPNSTKILLEGSEKDGPLYVAVFTPAGHCAGSTRWSGAATTLIAWGTDPSSSINPTPGPAFEPGDSLHVRIFAPTTSTHYKAPGSQITVSPRSDRPHLTDHRRYVAGGIYVLDTIRVHKTLMTRPE